MEWTGKWKNLQSSKQTQSNSCVVNSIQHNTYKITIGLVNCCHAFTSFHFKLNFLLKIWLKFSSPWKDFIAIMIRLLYFIKIKIVKQFLIGVVGIYLFTIIILIYCIHLYISTYNNSLMWIVQFFKKNSTLRILVP